MAQTTAAAPQQGRSLGFHLLVILGVCVVMYLLFFTILGWLTGHGDEVKVPVVTNQPLDKALSALQAQGFDVRVDSSFDPKQKPFVILGQQPEANSVVKYGRIVFLTVNKADPLKTTMPNLIGLSYRNAVMILQSNRFVIGDTIYKPDIAKGAILDQLYKGRTVKPGEIIPQGSRIDLVIGDGLGQTEMSVPEVIGQTYSEAIATLSAMGLQASAFFSGEITDSSSAVIYNQQPKAFNELNTQNKIHEGDIIDLFIKQNPTPEEIEENKKALPDVPEENADQNGMN